MSILKRLFRSTLAGPEIQKIPDFLQRMSANKKNVLHVGCGMPSPEKLPSDTFPNELWNEVRLDIDADVKPDIVASITNLSMIPGECFDAVYSSHNLEHLYPHEVPLALFEFFRVLKPNGFALLLLPDIQSIAELILQDKIEDPAYISAAGPVAPIDIIYGFRPALAAGNEFMAHRTGFTLRTLNRLLSQSGFTDIEVQQVPEHYSLHAICYRRAI